MCLKPAFLAIFATISLHAITFNKNYEILSPNQIEFGIFGENNKEKIGKIYDEKLFECKPALQGKSEFKKNSIIFYTNDLHKGINYTCSTQNSKISFKTADFEVLKVEKINSKNYIISFNDEIEASELNDFLKLDKSKFELKQIGKNNVLISLNSPLDKPNFTIEAKFKSKFGAKLAKEWNFVYEPKEEPEFVDNVKAATLVLNQPYFSALSGGKLGITFKFDTWIDTQELKKFIKIKNINQFKISDLDYKYDDDKGEWAYTLDITSDEFLPQTSYEIKILPGFGDYDRIVRSEENFTVKLGDYAPYVEFVDNLPYISSVGYIGIKSANAPSIKVDVEKLSRENYRYFLNFDNKNLESYSRPITSKFYELDANLNQKQEHKIKLDFADNSDGVYLITVHYSLNKSVSKVVYLSDIAVNAKIARNELFIFANRLGENVMLANANVKVFGHKNELLSTGATNDEGVFVLKQKNIHKNVKSIVVSLGNEQNFLIINKKERLNENAYYKSVDLNESVNAFVHFASNIIRPGENIKGAVYLKNEEFKAIKNMPVRLKFSDPTSKKLSEISLKTNELGVLSFDESLNTELSGSFKLDVIYASKIITSQNFHIESFVPSRIKNEVILQNESVKNHEILFAKAQSAYLFGKPASNLKGDIELDIIENEYTNENFSAYKFSDDSLKDTKFAKLYKKVKLDDKGEADIAFEINLPKTVPSVLEGYINFNINDDGKNVNTVKIFKIFAYDNIVGIKADKNLLMPNDKVKINAIALDSKNFKGQDNLLKFTVKRSLWDYNFDENGYCKWFKTLEDIDTFTKNTGEFEYSFAQSGDYVIVAQDIASGASASININVSGYNYSTLAPTKELSKAQIKLNSKTYKSGDKLIADISSIIKEGLALITLEADGVRAYRLAHIKNHSASVNFTLWNDFAGGYISANIYRLTDNANLPFRAYAKSYINANNDARRLKLEISSANTIKTNEMLKISLKTEPNADISLFLADLGVLNITHQSSPDPLNFFSIHLNDGVLDYDIYDKVTSYVLKGKMLNFGGDFALKSAAKMKEVASPVDNKNIETFVKLARLKANEKGEANYEILIPQGLNTAIRIDAIAATENQISSKSHNVKIKDDIILKPSILTHMLQGDEINANLRVMNTTKENKDVNLSITSENVELDINQENFSLAPDETKLLKLKLKGSQNGKAKYEITAKSGDDIYKNTQKLDIIRPYGISTFSKSFILDNKKVIKIPQGYSTLNIDASSNINSLLLNISKNLIAYPYGCAEQRSSRLLALLNLKTENEIQKQDVQRFIKAGMKDLLKMQKQNGEFGYWDEFSYTNKFASTFAASVLFELDRAGYKIDQDVKSRIANAISPADGGIHEFYPLYVKAKYQALDRATLNQAYDAKNYTSLLDSYLMAATLKLSGLNDEAENVLKNIDYTNFEQNSMAFSSKLRDQAFVLYLHSKYFNKNDFSNKLVNNIIQHIDEVGSTQERAFLLLALNEYFAGVDENKEAKIKISYDGKSEEFSTMGDHNVSVEGKEITLQTDGKFFVSISSKAAIKPEILHQKQKQDLDIYRSFVDQNGNPISLNSLKIGDVIYSKIELNSINTIQNGVLYEIFSPCLEPINEELEQFKRSQNTKNNLNVEHQNIKDDRILSFFRLADTGVLFSPYRVVLGGKCTLGVAKAENMYNEHQNDYDLEQNFFNVK
ncbi:MAG: alpha-2-macroglobulin [Campylobacter sp.]|nr:alpha-2-macroglobulin [Campylobacter sp.]